MKFYIRQMTGHGKGKLHMRGDYNKFTDDRSEAGTWTPRQIKNDPYLMRALRKGNYRLVYAGI